jgi:hypothetical protein
MVCGDYGALAAKLEHHLHAAAATCEGFLNFVRNAVSSGSVADASQDGHFGRATRAKRFRRVENERKASNLVARFEQVVFRLFVNGLVDLIFGESALRFLTDGAKAHALMRKHSRVPVVGSGLPVFDFRALAGRNH